MDKNEFQKRLRARRNEKKLSQLELAKLVNTTKGTISNYENGYSTPSNEMLVKLADVLEIPVDWLLGRTDDPRIPIDTTHEGDNAIKRGDIKKMIEMMDDLDELDFEGKILSGAKKEMFMEIFKEIFLPGIIEKASKQKDKDDEELPK